MGKRKKLLAKTVSLLLLCSMLLSACGVQGEAPQASSSGAQTSEAPGAPAQQDTALMASAEPLELTAHIHWGDVYVLNDNWTIEKEAAKLTNVSLKGTASEMEVDSKQAFNLMIASKDIPDLVGGHRDDINKYGVEGAFMPLNDLIEQYAPNIKKVLDANPDIKGAITASDGNIYQVPFVYEALVSEGWFIRQDWLDKLDLPVPTTVDELRDVLTAFVNEDPNGNGKKDEVGLFTRLNTAEDNKVLSVLSLFGVSDYWHLNREGKAETGLYTPAYKEAIKNVSEWYAQGLIDKEIFTRGAQSRDILFPENNGGVLHDWIPSSSGYNNKIKDIVPGFRLVGMLPPKDSNGDQWEVASRDKLNGEGWAISASNKHPVESIKYMDFWWTQAGRRLMTYGIEGDTYTMVNDVPTYTDKVLKADVSITEYINRMGGQIQDIAYLHDASYENFAMDEEGAKMTKLYTDSGVVNKLNPKLPALSFTEAELDIISSKYPPCRTYMLEQLQKWTFDGSKIDAEFDSYMQTLKSMGMDEIVSIYQAAYERLMGNQ